MKADRDWKQILAELSPPESRRVEEQASASGDVGARVYQLLLKTDSFKSLARAAGLKTKEIAFLSEDFRQELRRLVSSRNPGRHDPEKAWNRQDVEPFYRGFIGARTPGHLPRLRKIWSDWQQRRSRSRPTLNLAHGYAVPHLRPAPESPSGCPPNSGARSA